MGLPRWIPERCPAGHGSSYLHAAESVGFYVDCAAAADYDEKAEPNGRRAAVGEIHTVAAGAEPVRIHVDEPHGDAATQSSESTALRSASIASVSATIMKSCPPLGSERSEK